MDVPAGAALRWLGHDASNEFATLYALDRAEAMRIIVKALDYWVCPARTSSTPTATGRSPSGTTGISPALEGPGPLRPRRLRSRERLARLGAARPCPHVKDPERGFVSSANQAPTDADYPYYFGWDYASYERGARINEILRSARDVTPEDMVRMQADVLDIRARAVLPRLLEIVRGEAATEGEKKCVDELGAWNFEARAAFIAPTIFREFWNELNRLTWDDETTEEMGRMPRPSSQVMVDQILNHPDGEFFDERDTNGTRRNLDGDRRDGPSGRRSRTWRSGWGPSAKPGVGARSKGRRSGTWPGSRASAGRSRRTAPATSSTPSDAVWAPSWRMVVELGAEIRAWGNYPGGQSGNPGSKFYDGSRRRLGGRQAL